MLIGSKISVLLAGLLLSTSGRSGLLADTIPAVKSHPVPPGEAQLERGLASLSRGDLQAAESAFLETLRLDPGSIRALVGMADVAVRTGQRGEAESYLQKALKAVPRDPAVQRSWSRYLVSQKRYPEAEAALKKAIVLAPKSAAAPEKELGDLYLIFMNKPAQAIPEYRAAMRLDPSVPAVHYGLGNALAALGQWDPAEAELQQAGKTMPGDPLPAHALGVIYMRRREPAKAVQSFSEALRLRPELLPTLVARAAAYEALGNDDKALADYISCLRIDPRFAPAQVKLGMLHQRHNRRTEAEKAYLAAIAIDPNQAIAYNNLAYLAAEEKVKLDQAFKWASRAVELQPQAATFYDTLGWIRRAQGERDEAVAALKKGAALDPKDPTIFYHLGVVYAEERKYREAAAALRKALAMKVTFPGSDDARQRLDRLNQPQG